MIAGMLQEHFVGDAVVEVFPRMDLVADVDALFIEFVENGEPAGGEFFKAGVYQSCGSLGPGIYCRP